MPYFAIVKDRKARAGMFFLVFVVLPLALLFGSWLSDLWNFEDLLSTKLPDKEDVELDYDEKMADIAQQLKDVRCPAREGLELRDYWECLWRTSITDEGLQTHRDLFAEEIMQKAAETRILPSTSRSKRVKRDEENWEKMRIDAITKDLKEGLDNTEALHLCQHEIAPGVSIYDFVLCIRKSSQRRTFKATFQTTTIPPLPKGYESQDLPLLKLKDEDGRDVDFNVGFEPLKSHEKLSSFEGADPYLDDQYSDYRFKYNNLINKQRQPGWSYNGLFGPSRWHELAIRKFFVPLKSNVDLQKAIRLTDFAQTYPGIGEIADSVPNLQTGMDYRWTKDLGDNAYTRFLLPLIDRSDIIYYQRKGLIDPSVTVRPDLDVLEDVVKALENFNDETKYSLISVASRNKIKDKINGPKIRTEDKIPHEKTYRSVMQHFFKLDIKKFIEQQKTMSKSFDLRDEYDVIRRFLRAYVDVVAEQEKCVEEMIKEYDYRRTGTDLVDLIRKTKGQCNREPDGNDITHHEHNHTKKYKVDSEKLFMLYDKYFKRREARKQYTLPVFPKEYPICKRSEPSPLNIIKQKGRESTLRDYVFGDAAFRLHRFFMFFPLDSSNLLSLGLVGGERLDGSSVKLTGGAVKGVNLTFQYMHIRFASHWKGIGSEHQIDGKGAQMELQMIFTIAGSADEIKYWHVLARIQNNLFQFREKLVIILSVLVDVLSTDEEVKERIEKDELNQDPYLFEPLAQAAYQFHKVPEAMPDNFEQPRGYVSGDPVFRFIDFIPNPTKGTKFYTYRGSLSWPPCFGYVLWSVFEHRLYISKRQFDQFAKIPAFGMSDTNKASDNVRKLDDIKVEGELNAGSFAQEQELIKERTVDRYVLEGFHDVIFYGKQPWEGGVVGDEFYYTDMAKDSSNVQLASKSFVSLMVLFIVFIRFANECES